MSALRNDDLERALVDLGRAIEMPPEPDLAPRVMALIAGGVRPEPARRPMFRPGFAYAMAVTVTVVVALLVFSPSTRHAIADFLGVGGARIEFTGEPPAGIAEDLKLGHRVTRAEAAESVDFDLRAPADLGEPDEVYVKEDGLTVLVSMVWPADGELPRATSTGVGALLTQFRSSIEEDFIKKLTQFDTEFVRVTVDEVVGYWVEGPHTFMLLDEDGRPREDTARLSGNTALWERDGITYRLEGDFDRGTAIRIANSFR